MSRPTTATKAYTPPLFGNFGKKAKDLFKKKFEFENQAVLINRTLDNIEIETKVVAANEAPLRGVFKSVIPVRSVGTFNGVFESEFHTVADKESKTSYKFNNLARGLSVKVALTGVKADVKNGDADFPEGWASVEAEYSQDYFSGSVGVRTNGNKSLVDVVGAVGYDNIAVGGKAVIDTASKSAPQDFNFGAEVAGKSYTASAFTEKKRSALNLSYYTVVNSKQVIGAQANFGLVKPTRTLTFGTDYAVDVDTAARSYVKVDSSKDTAVLGLAIEHRLLDPKVLIGVASEYNLSPSAVTAGKFGVSLSFGDI